MPSFADVQYCIYADKVGGVQKGQKYADVIQGWSLKETQYKNLAPNALRFTYENLKSCKPHEKTRQKTICEIYWGKTDN